jgi:hypothetical protein
MTGAIDSKHTCDKPKCSNPGAAPAGRHRADITPMIARHLSCAVTAPAPAQVRQ